MEHIPTLSYDLIGLLDKVYPVVLPTPETTRDYQLYHAGQRSVVDFLLTLQQEQEERGLLSNATS